MGKSRNDVPRPRQELDVEQERRRPSGAGGSSIVDQVAFEQVFVEHLRTIHRYLARRVGTALADDLAAETFAVAFRRRRSFDPSRGSVRAWLFGIATILLRAHWREEQELLALEARLTASRVPTSVEVEEMVVGATLSEWVARALALLPAEQREVLLLSVWGALSSEEIALTLDVPAGTIRSRLSRARASLREHLGVLDLELQRFPDDHMPTLEDLDR